MKTLSISRGRLAADLGVDKSVVSRWLAGSHIPTDHNLARLTALIAKRRPDFTMLDWQVDHEMLAAKLRPADGEHLLPAGLDDWLPPKLVREALAQTDARGSAYEGFWRTTRPSIEAPGRFMHDRVLVRRRADGLLEWRMGVVDMRVVGLALPLQAQLFTIGADGDSGVFVFGIFNGVLRHRAEVLDGLTLTVQRTAAGMPVAACVLLEREGDLSGDWEADEAQHEQLIRAHPPLAEEGTVSAEVSAHLLRDAGPLAMAAGGPALLSLPFAQSLSRGPSNASSAVT